MCLSQPVAAPHEETDSRFSNPNPGRALAHVRQQWPPVSPPPPRSRTVAVPEQSSVLVAQSSRDGEAFQGRDLEEGGSFILSAGGGVVSQKALGFGGLG